MIVKFLLFVFGLILLVKGSDFFVKSSVSIAKKFGVSEFVIGLTLVALGTSIPELTSAIIASIRHESGLVIGNVMGANIANIGLITGIAASIVVIKTKKDMVDRDGYIMLFAAVLLCIFIFNGNISRIEASVLFLMYIAYTFFLITAKPELEGKYKFKEFIVYFFRLKYLVTIKNGIIRGLNHKKPSKINPTEKKKIVKMFKEGVVKDILIMCVSGVAIVFGANYFVTSAAAFAELLKIPEIVIGATVVSLGTTLPELSVTISATRRGFGNIALGNIIGSNITNIFLIVGVSGLISPLSAVRNSLFVIGGFLLLASLLLIFFIRSSWEIRRTEGIVFLLVYVVFIVFTFLSF